MLKIVVAIFLLGSLGACGAGAPDPKAKTTVGTAAERENPPAVSLRNPSTGHTINCGTDQTCVKNYQAAGYARI
jgi:hypothetical protein